MSYLSRWIDNGQTCEPCPKCGTMLKWSQFYDANLHKNVRALVCQNKRCKLRKKHVGISKVKGHVEMERFNARAR